jgi:hypothetical protein
MASVKLPSFGWAAMIACLRGLFMISVLREDRKCASEGTMAPLAQAVTPDISGAIPV